MPEHTNAPTFRYGFGRTLPNATFDEAVEKVTAALRDEGFGVLTRIDVDATLKAKLDVDFRRYAILGACNPTLAHGALIREPHIGLLLPCNVVVQESASGGIDVSVVDPVAQFELVGDAGLAPIARDVRGRLERVLRAIA